MRQKNYRYPYKKRSNYRVRDPLVRKYPYNEHIRVTEVRLIDQTGKNLGVKTVVEARKLAKEAELDLVVIAPQAKPPVAKLIDLEHFRYEVQKKEKMLRKKKKEHKPKEVKFKPLIGDGDYERKLRQIKKFLDGGYTVKVTIVKKRRVNRDVQEALKQRLLTDLRLYSNIVDIQDKGYNIHILIKSVGKNVKKDNENPAKEGKDKQK